MFLIYGLLFLSGYRAAKILIERVDTIQRTLDEDLYYNYSLKLCSKSIMQDFMPKA